CIVPTAGGQGAGAGEHKPAEQKLPSGKTTCHDSTILGLDLRDTGEKVQVAPIAGASGQAQVRHTGGAVVGGGELSDTGAPLVGDFDRPGGLIGEPEADKPVVESGRLLVDQDFTGGLIGDRDLDVLVAQFT